jgi:hypothetical protein
MTGTLTAFHNGFFDMSDPLGVVDRAAVQGCAPGTFPSDTIAGDRATQPSGGGGGSGFNSGCGTPRVVPGTIGPDRSGGGGQGADSTTGQRNVNALEVRTKGQAYGLELFVKKKLTAKLGGFLSYTLSRSERSWVPGEPSRLFYLDQTHILTALASFDLGSGWELGGRFRYVTGNLYTPCEGGIFSAISTAYLCLNGAFNSRRLAPFHQLDVRVDKRWVFSDFTLGAYLDLINAYNRTNPDFIDYNHDFTENASVTGSLPLVPSLGVRGEF